MTKYKMAVNNNKAPTPAPTAIPMIMDILEDDDDDDDEEGDVVVVEMTDVCTTCMLWMAPANGCAWTLDVGSWTWKARVWTVMAATAGEPSGVVATSMIQTAKDGVAREILSPVTWMVAVGFALPDDCAWTTYAISSVILESRAVSSIGLLSTTDGTTLTLNRMR